ncbi:FMN-dependent NADH-azoreductase 1 [compost metagenome]
MSTVLFVKANNRGLEQAVSVMLYQAFLDSYKESHPGDTIIELDLFKEELPYLNASSFREEALTYLARLISLNTCAIAQFYSWIYQ